MKVCLTGLCGFVGSRVARALRTLRPGWTVFGLDNLIRPGLAAGQHAGRYP